VNSKEYFFKYNNLIPDFPSFLAAVETSPPTCLRRNTLKTSTVAFENTLNHYKKLGKISFDHHQFSDLEITTLTEYDFNISRTLEHALGHFYVQGASSLLPVIELAPKPGELVLDLCAAPGGKTSMLASMMNNEGLLVANEPNMMRNRVLKALLGKLGVTNVMCTRYYGERFPANFHYDKILVDGPCSSEGTIRGAQTSASTWLRDLSFREKLYSSQKEILRKAFKLLKVGGELVYSTCTYGPEENEFVVQDLLDHYDNAKLINVNDRDDLCHGITSWQGKDLDPSMSMAKRVYPHKFNSWGFFYAKITKRQ
jgi:tRNA (cytosine49-C5)-methyltransferase